MGYGVVKCKAYSSDADGVRRSIKYNLDLDIIYSWAKNGEKINLIKEYRTITNAGLKESKDAIEAAQCLGCDGIVHLFKKVSGYELEPYTKEEFLNLIGNAIDNMHHLHYTDMLEATKALLNNVAQNGGLKKLAEDRQEFLEAI